MIWNGHKDSSTLGVTSTQEALILSYNKGSGDAALLITRQKYKRPNNLQWSHAMIFIHGGRKDDCLIKGYKK